MSDIKRWSTTAASNNSPAPDGWPENTMLLSQVNDAGREIMAAVRRQHENAEWLDFGHSLSQQGSTTFKALGSNYTAIYTAGRRILAYDGGGTMYGDILSSTFAGGDTTVVVVPDSGGMDSSLSAVAVGILSPTNFSIPKGPDLYAGARLSASALAAENATISYLVAHGGSLSSVTLVNPVITGAVLTGSASSLVVGSLGAQDISTSALRAAVGSLSNMVLIAPTITTGSASVLNVASLSANFANIGTASASALNVSGVLSASAANIGSLTAGFITILGGNASLNSLSVSSLRAQVGSLSSMVIVNSVISGGTLSGITIASGTASALSVAALMASFASLSAAQVTSLSAVFANIGSLTVSAATVGSIAILGGSASLNTLSVASLYAKSGTLSSVVIENSTIRASTLSGVTIASGTASAMTIASLVVGSLSTSALTFGGFKPAWVTLAETSLSAAAAQIDFTLTSFVTGYTDFEFIGSGIQPSTDAVSVLWALFSTDGGATYDLSASAYAYGNLGEHTGALVANNNNGDTHIEMGVDPFGNSANEQFSFRLLLLNPADTRPTHLIWNGGHFNATPNATTVSGWAMRNAQQDTDGIRFRFSAGNLAAGSRITMLGRPK